MIPTSAAAPQADISDDLKQCLTWLNICPNTMQCNYIGQLTHAHSVICLSCDHFDIRWNCGCGNFPCKISVTVTAVQSFWCYSNWTSWIMFHFLLYPLTKHYCQSECPLRHGHGHLSKVQHLWKNLNNTFKHKCLMLSVPTKHIHVQAYYSSLYVCGGEYKPWSPG